LSAVEGVVLEPFERALVPTGIRIALQPGYAGLVLPRSGHAIKTGLSIVNAPGLIDSNYRGEIKVIVYNSDPETPIEIAVGDRIAQLLIQETVELGILEVEEGELDHTKRGHAGFGSSGT
jgi:dUTP pyrophosphatase